MFSRKYNGILPALIFALVVPALAAADQPTTREYPTIYKSPRAMGMGGAYTAIGGRVDTLFYNPAGLINIPQDKGWEVNLINLTAEYSKDAENFLNDMQDAFDAQDANSNGTSDDEQLQAVNNVIARYRGKDLHARVADFTSIGKSWDKWAFGVGGVANGRIDALAHEGFGADGLLEVNADAIYGGIGGFSYGFTENLFGGLTVKVLHRETLIHNFTARELIDNQDNLSDYIQKDLRQGGDAFGFDAGLIWKFQPQSALKPALGVSIMNIGDLDFKDAGKIPQTVNLGVAINPEISWSRSLVVGIDYVDALNGYKQDKDMPKRLRLGGELQLFDITPAELALRAGWYEGYPTFGFDLRLTIVTITYANYSEEIGAYAGQDRDKRQLATINIGW